MQNLELESDNLRDVIRRAQEISEVSDEQLLKNPEVSAVVQAAEEAGIPKEATIQALRERLQKTTSTAVFDPGSLVFVSNGEGWYNVAKIDTLQSQAAKVSFLAGGEAVVPLEDIKHLRIAPGSKVFINYAGMWTEADIEHYNAEARTVTLSLWGSQVTHPISTIRLKDRRKDVPLPDQIKMWLYMGGAFLAGGGAGMILMRILMR